MLQKNKNVFFPAFWTKLKIPKVNEKCFCDEEPFSLALSFLKRAFELWNPVQDKIPVKTSLSFLFQRLLKGRKSVTLFFPNGNEFGHTSATRKNGGFLNSPSPSFSSHEISRSKIFYFQGLVFGFRQPSSTSLTFAILTLVRNNVWKVKNSSFILKVIKQICWKG